MDFVAEAKEIIDNWPLGRVGQGPDAAAILMECVANTDGDYIEIGSAFGGSAVLASKAMENRSGTVYCIDPFIGMNALEGTDDAFQAFWDNIVIHGCEQRVVAFYQHNPPFPMAIHYHKFSVGLIDGNHDGIAPLKDFISLDSRVTDYLLFDNAEKERVADTITRAIYTGSWEEYKAVEYSSSFDDNKIVKLVVLRRKKEIDNQGIAAKIRKHTGSNILFN